MPRRSVKSLKFKKRRYSRKKADHWKRRRKSAKKGSVRYRFNAPESVIGLPQVKKVTMYYRAFNNLTVPVGGTCVSHVLNLASIFDPDYTSTGHQPIGHDQWATYYTNYRVDSAIVKATFTHGATGETIPLLVGINMDLDATLHSNVVNTMMEHQRGKYQKLLLPNSREKAILRGKYQLSKFRKKKDIKDDDHIAAFGANPTKPAYLHLWAGGFNGNAATEDISVQFEIWQRCTLTEPKGVAGS